MNNRRKWLTTGLLLLILLLALGLRFYGLDAQSLWNDEGTSVALAQRDLVTIARDAARDIHPPLYYWLLSAWLRLAGTSEVGVRSLSALLGVLLVVLTCVLGWYLLGRWAGLVAAFLAAISPFQVYYSQETRMYMLLAVIAAGAILALVRLAEQGSVPVFVALVLLETAGLYTHYSFLFVVLILNLAYTLWLALTWRRALAGDAAPGAARAGRWVLSQAIVVLLYLPWLPTAIRQVSTWPNVTQASALLPPLPSILADTWRWQVLGPVIETSQASIVLFVAALVSLCGVLFLALGWIGKPNPRNWWSAGLLVLWIGLPVLLMVVLVLYREAYLKFLLVSAPALSLLLSSGLVAFPSSSDPRLRSAPMSRGVLRLPAIALRLAQILAAACILIGSSVALHNYYTDPAFARDDYRGIAAYVEAAGRSGDLVLLNAPGQQEVFGYYYGGDLPVYPLPESRPLDPAATSSSLASITQPGGRVFAVFWATDESDPERIIEGWLDEHAYKALDSWYGNVRLVAYAVPELVPSAPERVLNVPLRNPSTGDEITLLGYSLRPSSLGAGDIAQLTLFWQASATPAGRYKVFLHLLDSQNLIVGQRDAEPGGGALLTTLWTAGEVVTDNHGLPVYPATPPGDYRVEVGMYDSQTGQRLITPEGATQVWLEPLTVQRPQVPAPLGALDMQHGGGDSFGALALLGYDVYKLGYADQPDVPLRPGDVVQANLYWQAPTEPTGDWRVAIALVDSNGQEVAGLDTEPVPGYPTSRWQAGEVWRGQFTLALPGDARAGRYRLQVQPLPPDGQAPQPFLSESLRVEP